MEEGRTQEVMSHGGMGAKKEEGTLFIEYIVKMTESETCEGRPGILNLDKGKRNDQCEL